MKHPNDPDASFRDQTRCRHDAIKQIDIRTHENLLTALDNESNVLTSRNLHSAVNTVLIILCCRFLCFPRFWVKYLKIKSKSAVKTHDLNKLYVLHPTLDTSFWEVHANGLERKLKIKVWQKIDFSINLIFNEMLW